MPSVIVCDGVISVLADGSTSCSTGWSTQVATVPFDASQIDPAVATALFGGGFALFIVPWATAWGLFQLLRLLR